MTIDEARKAIGAAVVYDRGGWEHVGRWADKSRIAVSANEPVGEFAKLDARGLTE